MSREDNLSPSTIALHLSEPCLSVGGITTGATGRFSCCPFLPLPVQCSEVTSGRSVFAQQQNAGGAGYSQRSEAWRRLRRCSRGRSGRKKHSSYVPSTHLDHSRQHFRGVRHQTLLAKQPCLEKPHSPWPAWNNCMSSCHSVTPNLGSYSYPWTSGNKNVFACLCMSDCVDRSTRGGTPTLQRRRALQKAV